MVESACRPESLKRVNRLDAAASEISISSARAASSIPFAVFIVSPMTS
jgi:hypothetical protein